MFRDDLDVSTASGTPAQPEAGPHNRAGPPRIGLFPLKMLGFALIFPQFS